MGKKVLLAKKDCIRFLLAPLNDQYTDRVFGALTIRIDAVDIMCKKERVIVLSLVVHLSEKTSRCKGSLFGRSGSLRNEQWAKSTSGYRKLGCLPLLLEECLDNTRFGARNNGLLPSEYILNKGPCLKYLLKSWDLGLTSSKG